MKKINENIVLKGLAGDYKVLCKDQIVQAKARGKLKTDGRVVVGDYVEIEKDNFAKDSYIITKLKPRKNFTTRPQVANIDQLVIVVAAQPEPDFYLIDKLLINCIAMDIDPLIVVNKDDIAQKGFLKDIKDQYSKVAEVISCSATTGQGIAEVKKHLSGKLSVFAGQSAVGKSTLLNAIDKDLKLSTGGLSEKTQRGRHTTRECQIYLVENMMIADTPGFSMLDLKDIQPKDLSSYFIDFDEYRAKCRYTDCSHVDADEKECGVKRAVKQGLINEKRYQRYLDLYKEIKKAWENKF